MHFSSISASLSRNDYADASRFSDNTFTDCALYLVHPATHKKLELAEKYGRLKKAGKLEKFLAKKRRKNASRDRKDLPARF